MLIKQIRPGVFNVTLSGYELAALTSAARWATEGAKGELTEEAVAQLKQVINNYDKATAKMGKDKERAKTSESP